ncbi:protein translocase subunit SecF [Feifania hominis]|uniref:Protein-export membrane protein SecF n=1 Tax=Feifania hominis TaxID=2763660 RepID=A0A926DCC9_9FIRM|nr:protein translocase subunit SecF [Feifania hominis]MBC8535226.1 protein translocase subunit SecF [Feifania hominis]
MSKLKIDIVKNRKIFYIISVAVLLAGVISVMIQGFNLGIDFSGGTIIHINMYDELDRARLDEIEGIVEGVIGEKPSVQKSEDAVNGYSVIIKTKELTTEKRTEVFEAVKEKYGLADTDQLAVDNVSATVGKDLRNNAILAVGIATLLMLIYIWIRFELITGLVAVLMLLHDVCVMLAFYSLFGIQMNTTFIAAMLTIVGYSINATIIIFDRVRENLRVNNKDDFESIVNQSIWQTMNRSLNTTITTLLTITMVFVFGVTAVRNFALPIIVGIISGFYSSVLLAGPMWVTFKNLGVGKKK